MLEGMQSATLSSLQLWLTPPSAEYGWKEMVTASNPDRPFGPAPLRSVALAALGPASVWSDVSELLGRADWGFDDRPWSLARFTARLDDAGNGSPPAERQAWIRLLEQRLPEIWPNMTDKDGNFLWSTLFDPEGRTWQERLAWQHWTSTPYLLTAPGAPHTRLAPGGSGVAGLTLAGEWTANAVGIASHEAAAASGIEAAAHLMAAETGEL
jgi:hypothetical protein